MKSEVKGGGVRQKQVSQLTHPNHHRHHRHHRHRYRHYRHSYRYIYGHLERRNILFNRFWPFSYRKGHLQPYARTCG